MTKTNAPEWHLENRKLSKLKDYPFNPRTLSEEAEEKLKSNLLEHGIIDRPCVTIEGMIIGGHQRTKVLKKLGIKELEVWVPDRELDEKEIAKLNMSLNKVGGDFDIEMVIALYDQEFLIETGWKQEELDDLWGTPLEGEKEAGTAERTTTTIESNDDEEEGKGEKEYDETIIDGLEVMVKFVITIPNEEASSFENQLDEVVAKFPTAVKKKLI